MAEKLKMTVKQLLDLRAGLNSLDAVRTVREGHEVEVTPFDFDTKTRYALMKNAQAVEREAFLIDKLDQAVLNELGVYDQMPKTPESAQKVAQVNARISASRQMEIEVDGLFMLNLSALLYRPVGEDKKLKTNVIPQSAINRLAPIIIAEEAP